MRIVIVEDEAVIREGLTNMINGNTPHTVVGACKDGSEGIELIESVKPDCVITDIRMSKMSGLEMLSALRKKNIMPYSVIISGYSEFEYAKEGIVLGVEDYLLKPISIDELETVLNKIEKKLLKNSDKFGGKLGNYLLGYLFGTDTRGEEAKDMLLKHLPPDNDAYGIFVSYYGNADKEKTELERLLRNIKRQYPDYVYVDAAEEHLQLRIFIVKASEDALIRFAETFDETVVGDWSVSKFEIPWAADICFSVEEWRDTFAVVRKALTKCLSCGSKRLLSADGALLPSIERRSAHKEQELIYPIGLEKKLLLALGAGNREETRKRTEEFLEFVMRREYDAEDIRRVVIKLTSSMLDTAREINQKAYELLRTKDYMHTVFTAYTRTEIEEILGEMGHIICEREKKEGISNYTINRTVEYIRNHYKEGITLEETAAILGITPEYLSMLFKREMGMNFSAFLKKFRISHAKRLLKGTDMKIYEVAEACGYNNSNYFTRVFKEVTGISPADFR